MRELSLLQLIGTTPHRAGRPIGVLQFPSHTSPPTRLEEIAERYATSGDWVMPVDYATASSLAGLPVRQSGCSSRTVARSTWSTLCDELLGQQRDRLPICDGAREVFRQTRLMRR